MSKDFSTDIGECLMELNHQGTILYPTDTVWGLGCDAASENAVQKIIQIKNRPLNKSFIVLVDSFDMLKRYISDIDESIVNYLNQVNKPTTVIYENASGFAQSVYAPDGSVAVRICNEAFCQMLISEYGKPIVSTSANKSGEPAPKIFSEINPNILHATDYTVFYRRDDDKLSQTSSIVKFIGNEIKIIRE